MVSVRVACCRPVPPLLFDSVIVIWPPLPCTVTFEPEPAAASPPVPATGVLLPSAAAVGLNVIWSMVAPAVPTRNERKRGITIEKSRCAVVLSAPPPVTVVDSAFAGSAADRVAPSATASAALSSCLVAMVLLPDVELAGPGALQPRLHGAIESPNAGAALCCCPQKCLFLLVVLLPRHFRSNRLCEPTVRPWQAAAHGPCRSLPGGRNVSFPKKTRRGV